MRGTILRALPACVLAFTTGCFMLGSSVSERAAAPRSETHEYWNKVNEIFSRRAPSQDLKSMVQLVKEQTNALKELPPEGVDKELVAAVEGVIRAEEEVLERAELFEGDAAKLKENKAMAVLFAGANKKAADAKKKVRAMRDALNSRHGGGFAAITG